MITYVSKSALYRWTKIGQRYELKSSHQLQVLDPGECSTLQYSRKDGLQEGFK